MNYKEQIEQKRLEIKEIQKLQEDEIKKIFPNIIGKFYRFSTSTLYKIKKITHMFSQTHCLADVISITIRKG